MWGRYKNEMKATGVWQAMSPAERHGGWLIFDSLLNRTDAEARARLVEGLSEEEHRGAGAFLYWLRRQEPNA